VQSGTRHAAWLRPWPAGRAPLPPLRLAEAVAAVVANSAASAAVPSLPEFESLMLAVFPSWGLGAGESAQGGEPVGGALGRCRGRRLVSGGCGWMIGAVVSQCDHCVCVN
jgi:hypothetical protein